MGKFRRKLESEMVMEWKDKYIQYVIISTLISALNPSATNTKAIAQRSYALLNLTHPLRNIGPSPNLYNFNDSSSLASTTAATNYTTISSIRNPTQFSPAQTPVSTPQSSDAHLSQTPPLSDLPSDTDGDDDDHAPRPHSAKSSSTHISRHPDHRTRRRHQRHSSNRSADTLPPPAVSASPTYPNPSTPTIHAFDTQFPPTFDDLQPNTQHNSLHCDDIDLSEIPPTIIEENEEDIASPQSPIDLVPPLPKQQPLSNSLLDNTTQQPSFAASPSQHHPHSHHSSLLLDPNVQVSGDEQQSSGTGTPFRHTPNDSSDAHSLSSTNSVVIADDPNDPGLQPASLFQQRDLNKILSVYPNTATLSQYMETMSHNEDIPAHRKVDMSLLQSDIASVDPKTGLIRAEPTPEFLGDRTSSSRLRSENNTSGLTITGDFSLIGSTKPNAAGNAAQPTLQRQNSASFSHAEVSRSMFDHDENSIVRTGGGGMSFHANPHDPISSMNSRSSDQRSVLDDVTTIYQQQQAQRVGISELNSLAQIESFQSRLQQRHNYEQSTNGSADEEPVSHLYTPSMAPTITPSVRSSRRARVKSQRKHISSTRQQQQQQPQQQPVQITSPALSVHNDERGFIRFGENTSSSQFDPSHHSDEHHIPSPIVFHPHQPNETPYPQRLHDPERVYDSGQNLSQLLFGSDNQQEKPDNDIFEDSHLFATHQPRYTSPHDPTPIQIPSSPANQQYSDESSVSSTDIDDNRRLSIRRRSRAGRRGQVPATPHHSKKSPLDGGSTDHAPAPSSSLTGPYAFLSRTCQSYESRAHMLHANAFPRAMFNQSANIVRQAGVLRSSLTQQYRHPTTLPSLPDPQSQMDRYSQQDDDFENQGKQLAASVLHRPRRQSQLSHNRRAFGNDNDYDDDDDHDDDDDDSRTVYDSRYPYPNGLDTSSESTRLLGKSRGMSLASGMNSSHLSDNGLITPKYTTRRITGIDIPIVIPRSQQHSHLSLGTFIRQKVGLDFDFTGLAERLGWHNPDSLGGEDDLHHLHPSFPQSRFSSTARDGSPPSPPPSVISAADQLQSILHKMAAYQHIPTLQRDRQFYHVLKAECQELRRLGRHDAIPTVHIILPEQRIIEMYPLQLRDPAFIEEELANLPSFVSLLPQNCQKYTIESLYCNALQSQLELFNEFVSLLEQYYDGHLFNVANVLAQLEYSEQLLRQSCIDGLQIDISFFIRERDQQLEKIKKTLKEVHRGLGMLNDYIQLNLEGLVDIMKKHDEISPSFAYSLQVILPIVFSTHFAQTTAGEMMKSYNEVLFSRAFGHALTERFLQQKDTQVTPFAWLRFGFFFGVVATLVAANVVLFCLFPHQSVGSSVFLTAFPVFRVLAYVTVLCWVWGLATWICEQYRINYQLVLQLNPHNYIRPMQTFEISAFLTVLLLICFTLFMFSTSYDIQSPVQKYALFITFLIFVALLFLPLPTLHHRTRFYTLSRILYVFFSPFTPATIQESLVGDIMTSLTRCFYDLAYVVCFYSNYPVTAHLTGLEFKYCNNHVKQYAWWIKFVPQWFRFLQNIRNIYYSGEWYPFSVNALKYALTFPDVVLGWFLAGSGYEFRLLFPWLFFAGWCQVLSWWWDTSMDWQIPTRFQAASDNYETLLKKLEDGQSTYPFISPYPEEYQRHQYQQRQLALHAAQTGSVNRSSIAPAAAISTIQNSSLPAHQLSSFHNDHEDIIELSNMIDGHSQQHSRMNFVFISQYRAFMLKHANIIHYAPYQEARRSICTRFLHFCCCCCTTCLPRRYNDGNDDDDDDASRNESFFPLPFTSVFQEEESVLDRNVDLTKEKPFIGEEPTEDNDTQAISVAPQAATTANTAENPRSSSTTSSDELPEQILTYNTSMLSIWWFTHSYIIVAWKTLLSLAYWPAFWALAMWGYIIAIMPIRSIVIHVYSWIIDCPCRKSSSAASSSDDFHEVLLDQHGASTQSDHHESQPHVSPVVSYANPPQPSNFSSAGSVPSSLQNPSLSSDRPRSNPTTLNLQKQLSTESSTSPHPPDLIHQGSFQPSIQASSSGGSSPFPTLNRVRSRSIDLSTVNSPASKKTGFFPSASLFNPSALDSPSNQTTLAPGEGFQQQPPPPLYSQPSSDASISMLRLNISSPGETQSVDLHTPQEQQQQQQPYTINDVGNNIMNPGVPLNLTVPPEILQTEDPIEQKSVEPRCCGRRVPDTSISRAYWLRQTPQGYNFQREPNFPAFLLPHELVATVFNFPLPIYYLCVGLDLLLRGTFVLSSHPDIAQKVFGVTNDWMSFCLGILELFRRGMWIVLRLENEHLKLTKRLQAITLEGEVVGFEHGRWRDAHNLLLGTSKTPPDDSASHSPLPLSSASAMPAAAAPDSNNRRFSRDPSDYPAAMGSSSPFDNAFHSDSNTDPAMAPRESPNAAKASSAMLASGRSVSPVLTSRLPPPALLDSTPRPLDLPNTSNPGAALPSLQEQSAISFFTLPPVPPITSSALQVPTSPNFTSQPDSAQSPSIVIQHPVFDVSSSTPAAADVPAATITAPGIGLFDIPARGGAISSGSTQETLSFGSSIHGSSHPTATTSSSGLVGSGGRSVVSAHYPSIAQASRLARQLEYQQHRLRKEHQNKLARHGLDSRADPSSSLAPRNSISSHHHHHHHHHHQQQQHPDTHGSIQHERAAALPQSTKRHKHRTREPSYVVEGDLIQYTSPPAQTSAMAPIRSTNKLLAGGRIGGGNFASSSHLGGKSPHGVHYHMSESPVLSHGTTSTTESVSSDDDDDPKHARAVSPYQRTFRDREQRHPVRISMSHRIVGGPTHHIHSHAPFEVSSVDSHNTLHDVLGHSPRKPVLSRLQPTTTTSILPPPQQFSLATPQFSDDLSKQPSAPRRQIQATGRSDYDLQHKQQDQTSSSSDSSSYPVDADDTIPGQAFSQSYSPSQAHSSIASPDDETMLTPMQFGPQVPIITSPPISPPPPADDVFQQFPHVKLVTLPQQKNTLHALLGDMPGSSDDENTNAQEQLPQNPVTQAMTSTSPPQATEHPVNVAGNMGLKTAVSQPSLAILLPSRPTGGGASDLVYSGFDAPYKPIRYLDHFTMDIPDLQRHRPGGPLADGSLLHAPPIGALKHVQLVPSHTGTNPSQTTLAREQSANQPQDTSSPHTETPSDSPHQPK